MAQQLDRWGNPMPRQLKLTNGSTVTERYFDRSQYHQNCRTCGGDVYGMPIWYVRPAEAKVTPKHAECPPEPTPYVEPQRSAYAPSGKGQSVYAQRRSQQQPIRREPAYRPQYFEAGGKIWENE